MEEQVRTGFGGDGGDRIQENGGEEAHNNDTAINRRASCGGVDAMHRYHGNASRSWKQ